MKILPNLGTTTEEVARALNRHRGLRVPFLIGAALTLARLPAHSSSFNCNRGRSLTEKMICHDPALSRLDDTLSQLYWKARRRVTDRRAFLTDSDRDSKWAWRQANCRDATAAARGITRHMVATGSAASRW